jgi:lipoate-protein ligase A
VNPEDAVHCLDLSLPTPAENLACDEALLDACDAGEGPGVLRFWEPSTTFLVVGYANRAASEVNLPACQAEGIPVLRRISGGGAVVQAPGCLNYALVLRTEASGPLASIGQTNALVLGRHGKVLQRLVGAPVSREGLTDLVVAGRKVSGNSQRRKHRAVLFHGTFLLGVDSALLERFLLLPSRAPAYRAGRSHAGFVANLTVAAAALKQALRSAWQADTPLEAWPRRETMSLVQTRYACREWNLKW